MKTFSLKLCALLLALTATGTAAADHNFGVGVKAGTLGIGVEGTWRPLPYIELRLGANQYDYSDSGLYGGVTDTGSVGNDIIGIYEGLVQATSYIIERVANALE